MRWNIWILQNAAILIGLAAVGELTMLAVRLRGTDRPSTWLALSGVAILGYLYLNVGLPSPGQLGAALLRPRRLRRRDVALRLSLEGAASTDTFHARSRPDRRDGFGPARESPLRIDTVPT